MESLHENEMALKEFQMLEEDANVFKMIGPVLVKQDSKEAQENVKRRLEYFKVGLTIEYVGHGTTLTLCTTLESLNQECSLNPARNILFLSIVYTQAF